MNIYLFILFNILIYSKCFGMMNDDDGDDGYPSGSGVNSWEWNDGPVHSNPGSPIYVLFKINFKIFN
jgi:hypothetical protein